ncbi:unnamed protein product [[Candida] boidinii]|nr:unnamed protein product [[Candida] boidinii]
MSSATLSDDELSSQFSKLGFQDAKIKEILKNKKVSKSLSDFIIESNLNTELEKTKSALLHNLATLVKGENLPNLKFIVDDIVNGKLLTNLQVGEAYKYIKSNGSDSNIKDMEAASGVGINVFLAYSQILKTYPL